MDVDTIRKSSEAVHKSNVVGGLSEMLIEKWTRHVRLYLILLTAMYVKLYKNRMYVSSTSLTMIVDDEQIPVLKQFKSDDRIDKIRKKRGWDCPSCGGEKCKKGNLDRKHGRFWCDSCHSSVDYPDEDETAFPSALVNIMGAVHTLELKSNLYYEHANSESFTCWIVVLEDVLDESGSSGTLVASGSLKTDVFMPLTITSSVTTPSKPSEQKKPRSEKHHNSDREESFVADSKTKGSDVDCSSEAGKRRRLVLDSSE
nr:hypothetical protein [Tanacetum cinerariifolium]